MDRSVCGILTVLVIVWMESLSGFNIELIPQYPVVSQSVILNVTGIPGNIITSSWYKGPNTDYNNLIILYLFNPFYSQTEGNRYFSRAKGFPNGSLLISNLTLTDQGTYRLNIVYAPFIQNQTSVKLTVYETSTPKIMESASSAVVIAGIICGTIVGIILIISVTILLYKKYAFTTKEVKTETYDDVQGPLPEYYNDHSNSQALADSEDSTYTGMQFAYQSSYNKLQR
ncbi:carcinoembryonic antigen-related cell adhesion molecule 4-like [Pelobates fuscus]|uniref:carcinoembryonic antigen-related cell adhesion molecule 4-like n=1 Tax=Pelobates fuscus TaxID=191477 RepID=UPI002FE4F192